MPRPGAILTAVALAATPFVAHFLSVVEGARPLAIAYGWAMAAVVAIGLARAAGVGVAESALVAGLLGLAWYLGAGTRYAVFLPPAAILLAFLWFFGRTLLPGRVPFVTSIARIVHASPVLAPEMERYTRQVTWAWCGFFAAALAVSGLLAALAPIAMWSIFANVLVLPLVAAMFAAEYAYRRARFPAHDHVSPLAVLQRLGRAGISAAAAPGKCAADSPTK